MNSAGLSRIAGKAAGPIGLIGAIGGFISDVLAPLGDFAPAVTGISFLAAIIFGIMTVRESRNNRHDMWDTAYSGGLFVSICSMLIFAVWSVILGAGPERGYLADNIDPIAQLQGQLLGIEEDLAEIQETTTQTAEDVQTIATAQAQGNQTAEDTQTQVNAMATAQAQGFADIQAAFASLQQSNTIVDNPTTPQEFYSNARIHQLRGNTAEAVNAYEGYLEFGLEYIDPVQDYADLLKATEGNSRAREIITSKLAENPGSLVLDFVATSMLETADERLVRYEALASRAPQFGPAYWGITQTIDVLFSEGGGFRALNEKFIAAFTRLRDLEADQNFTRYYIDKNRAVGLFDAAMRRFEQAQGAANSSTLLSQPEIYVTPLNTGFTFTFIIADAVGEWFASFDDPDNLRGLGVTQSQIGDTANVTINDVPLTIGDHILYYKYVDKNGVESPVFEYPMTVYPLVGSLNVQPGDFTSGTSTAQIVVFAYMREDTEQFNFTWGLAEDEITNDADLPFAASLNTITVPDLQPGEYTLWIQAEGLDGELLGPVPFPFTVQ